jgi:pimeloyl-ACP methyl ester carboxylesterase
VESAGLGRFVLLGMSQGRPVAVSYVVRHPDRVTRLILFGTWAATCASR